VKRKNISLCRALRKKQTDAEQKLWSVLRNRQLHGVKFRRQFAVGSFILDIYSPEHRVCIEADGGSHYSQAGVRQDELRKMALEKIGIRVLRFISNEDILNNMGGVCEVIADDLKSPPHLNPLPQGERK